MEDGQQFVTELLRRWRGGERGGPAPPIPPGSDEFDPLAARYLRDERPGHTLQCTALVNEAYLRLADQHTDWQNRAHFYGVAAQILRRTLVDHARERKAVKRGMGYEKVSLDEALAVPAQADVDLIALDASLDRLAEMDPKRARLGEFEYFAGLPCRRSAQV